eukprot:8159702-Lingulodinium_polyedra.AAC.1
MAKMSPFQTRFMSDLAQVLCKEEVPQAEEHAVHKVCQHVFMGFGQTKIVEDANREAREREQQDVLNRKISISKMWDALRSRGVLDMHRRREISGASVAPLPQKPGEALKALYTCPGHEPALDLAHITSRRTWPSFTAQGAQSLAGQTHLLRHCHLQGTWAQAQLCWQSCFLPLGTVVHCLKSDAYILSLGEVGFTACLGWRLQVHQDNVASTTYFQLATSADPVLPVQWFVPLDLKDFQ